jgi:hypothetical protein
LTTEMKKKITVSLLYQININTMNCHSDLKHLVCHLVQRLKCFFEIFHESIKKIRGKDENFARLCYTVKTMSQFRGVKIAPFL